MNRVWKFVKISMKLVGIFIAIICIAGLIYRFLIFDQLGPLGELIEIHDDINIHVNITGEKNDRPTIVIEGGMGMATEYYHWLSEGLKDSFRVIRYDRPGIGYSDVNETAREPENIAKELHELLNILGESPPYILVGHSLGGPYIRVFTELYSDEVEAMVLLDSTHPDRLEKIESIPAKSSFKFKSLVCLYDIQAILGDLGVMLLYDQLIGPMFPREMDGLPKDINERTIDFLDGGNYIRTIGNEFSQYHNTLTRADQVNNFGQLPIRVIAATRNEIPDEIYQRHLKKGVDLRKNRLESIKMQNDLVNLSTNSKIITVNGNHNTIFTIKENADLICREIFQL